MKSMAEFTLEQNRQDSEQLHEMFWAIYNCPYPVVGRLHGHVMGGAVGLAALCDVAAAVEGTQFCFSEVRLGLAPAVISPFVLEKMSASYGRRYMLTGEVFGAAEAKASGLVQFVGDELAVDAFLDDLLKVMAANGSEAVRATKGLLRAITEIPEWEKRRELTTQVIAERRVSAEGQEGLRAFFEKRSPSWK
jgi:methylglutaconyl-CoA hydratase